MNAVIEGQCFLGSGVAAVSRAIDLSLHPGKPGEGCPEQRVTGRSQAQTAGPGRAVWMRQEAGAEAWGDSRATNPLPLPQAGIQTPTTAKPPLLGAAWHSPVRDTLAPFSLWDRRSEVRGEEGSAWTEERAHCTHSCPLRFSEFCSHADSPEGRGQGCREGPREGGSPWGLRDSRNVCLVPSLMEESHRALYPKTYTLNPICLDAWWKPWGL